MTYIESLHSDLFKELVKFAREYRYIIDPKWKDPEGRVNYLRRMIQDGAYRKLTPYVSELTERDFSAIMTHGSDAIKWVIEHTSSWERIARYIAIPAMATVQEYETLKELGYGCSDLFLRATKYANIPLVRHIMKDWTQITMNSGHLRYAFASGSVEMVKLLMEKMANEVDKYVFEATAQAIPDLPPSTTFETVSEILQAVLVRFPLDNRRTQCLLFLSALRCPAMLHHIPVEAELDVQKFPWPFRCDTYHELLHAADQDSILAMLKSGRWQVRECCQNIWNDRNLYWHLDILGIDLKPYIFKSQWLFQYLISRGYHPTNGEWLHAFVHYEVRSWDLKGLNFQPTVQEMAWIAKSAPFAIEDKFLALVNEDVLRAAGITAI